MGKFVNSIVTADLSTQIPEARLCLRSSSGSA